MSDINNNGENPFNEQDTRQQDPYNQPAQGNDPYNQPAQGSNPYNQPMQNTYNTPNQQQGQYMQDVNSPYDQSYNQQNVYNRQNIPQNGGYVQSPYGTQYRQYMPAQKMSTGMAVASMVLGICSICLGLFMFAFPPLFLLPIIGLILGIVFKCKHLPVGRGMSTAGIITSAIGLVIPLLFLILVVVLLISNGAELMEFMKEYSPEDYRELYELYGDQFPEWFDGAMKFFGIM